MGADMPPQPDFSGRWTLVAAMPSDDGVATALTVRQTVTRTTIRGEPMAPFFRTIDIERQFDGRTTTETHLIGIAGGVVGGLVGPSGSSAPAPRPTQSHYAVRWDGDTLVFELGTHTGDALSNHDWTERRETWMLEANGELAIEITTSASSHRERTVSATYRRRH
jgi:hypothetical protein